MSSYYNAISLKKSVQWKALLKHQANMQNFNMKGAFLHNQNRFKDFSLKTSGILLDYSKNLITRETRSLLISLAHAVNLGGAIQSLFSIENKDWIDERSVLYTVLRSPLNDKTLSSNLREIHAQVHRVLEKMSYLVKSIHEGSWRGGTDERITDIVNIGIGGSYLGPKLISEALASHSISSLRFHYISGIDSTNFHEVIKKIRVERTLFILSSKSLSTSETLKNYENLRTWYLSKGGEEKKIDRHFIVVSSNTLASSKLGIPKKNIITLGNWIGGRHSIWTGIGLPIALSIGMSNFKKLLSGAYKMDKHFQEAPFERNMPVLIALLGIWYRNFWNTQTYGVFSYDYRLRNFNKYLQQLDMESNGKNIGSSEEYLTIKTGPVVWGSLGSEAQHAYHQILHQGSDIIPSDFIVSKRSTERLPEYHQWKYASCVAQTRLLMLGITSSPKEESRHKSPTQKALIGNKPTNTLVIEEVSPSYLGALIALYEHKVYVQGVVWGINSFSQPGVDLSKKSVLDLYQDIVRKNYSHSYDSSTQNLINYLNDF